MHILLQENVNCFSRMQAATAKDGEEKIDEVGATCRVGHLPLAKSQGP